MYIWVFNSKMFPDRKKNRTQLKLTFLCQGQFERFLQWASQDTLIQRRYRNRKWPQAFRTTSEWGQSDQMVMINQITFYPESVPQLLWPTDSEGTLTQSWNPNIKFSYIKWQIQSKFVAGWQHFDNFVEKKKTTKTGTVPWGKPE